MVKKLFSKGVAILSNLEGNEFREPINLDKMKKYFDVRNPQAYGVSSSSKIKYRSHKDCKLSIEILNVLIFLNTEFWFENQVKINKMNLIKT